MGNGVVLAGSELYNGWNDFINPLTDSGLGLVATRVLLIIGVVVAALVVIGLILKQRGSQNMIVQSYALDAKTSILVIIVCVLLVFWKQLVPIFLMGIDATMGQLVPLIKKIFGH
jgi:hypothetical protein